MSRSNVSIVKGFNADPAEMRAMEVAEDRIAWMDRHFIVKYRAGKWAADKMAAIGQKAGIRFELDTVVL